MNDLTPSIKWLAKQQSDNGSFLGFASESAKPFRQVRTHQTVFMTSLILNSLRDVAAYKNMTARAIAYLKDQQSKNGSWNYWQCDAAINKGYPYPDDLDDTACAFLALSIHEPSYIDGAQMAKLAKLLIKNEAVAGGPYRTWLVEPDMYNHWGDFDLAVNANIGALMAEHGIGLPNLEKFIDQHLIDQQINSIYYVGSAPIIYFLSGWYRGERLGQLKQQATQALVNAIKENNALSLGLLLSAGCKLKLTHNRLLKAYVKLNQLRANDHWAAEAMYLDPIIDGKQYYAGSDALTTAYAIEALTLYENIRPAKKWHDANKISITAPDLPLEMQRVYLNLTERIIKNDTDHQIAGIANVTADAFKLNLSQSKLRYLNLASLNGWLAYTLFDDLYDNDGQAIDITIANFAVRQALNCYRKALPDHPGFQELVDQTYNTMDAANRWELLNCHGFNKSPDYGDYSKLAEKSWGHILSACGVLVEAGYTLESKTILNLQKFFHNLLIARQLNDDAHDWLADMKKGQITVITILMLCKYEIKERDDVIKNEAGLIQYFWEEIIEEASVMIRLHIHKARQALQNTNIINPSAFESWLDKIEAATNQAVNDSLKTKHFIKTLSSY